MIIPPAHPLQSGKILNVVLEILLPDVSPSNINFSCVTNKNGQKLIEPCCRFLSQKPNQSTFCGRDKCGTVAVYVFLQTYNIQVNNPPFWVTGDQRTYQMRATANIEIREPIEIQNIAMSCS